MTKNETITYLGLDSKDPIEETEKKSTYELTQSEYAKVFTLLDRNESDWNEDSEEIDNSDEDLIESSYYSKSGKLWLKADLDKDKYTITIEEEEP